MSDTSIDVFIDLPSFPGPVQAGRLWSHFRKGRESASFEYNKEWLANPHRFALEPLLPLADGTFHTNPGQSVFGAIGDSTPDRWGRKAGGGLNCLVPNQPMKAPIRSLNWTTCSG